MEPDATADAAAPAFAAGVPALRLCPVRILVLLAATACAGGRSDPAVPIAGATPAASIVDPAMQGELQDPAPPSAPGRDCEAQARAVRERVQGQGFHVLVEEPFVVAGDGGKAAVERSAVSTVRWAVKLLKQDFFRKEPARALEIWLFDGAESYQKHARELFGDTPTTPYGR